MAATRKAKKAPPAVPPKKKTGKHPGGRPSKLTPKFIDAAKKVINYSDNALIHTDGDLLFLINERLPEGERISDATLENWKAGKFENNPNGPQFLGLMRKALIKQRSECFRRLKTDDEGYKRWQWIIERKFKEWNVPQKQQIGGDPDNPVPVTFSLRSVLKRADGQ